MDGRPAQGLWQGPHLSWHINPLKMRAVFLAKHFFTDLRGYCIAPPVQAGAADATLGGCKLLSLIARFIREARRLRPPVRVKVLSWNLALVLKGLIGIPFKPLESAPVKILTLNMFFFSELLLH